MDRRVLNVGYSKSPVKLFMVLASIMDDEELCAAPPWVCPDGITIRQTYGTCPAQVGGDIYYRMAEDGKDVLVYDPEDPHCTYPVGEEIWQWKDEFSSRRFPFLAGLKFYITSYLKTGD